MEFQLVLLKLQQNRISVWVWSLSWQKEKPKLRLGKIVVLDLPKKLENTYRMLYFDNFFNSATLVEKLFNSEIYCIDTVQSNRKNITIVKNDIDMKKGDIDYQYPNDVVAVKWFDNRGVTMVDTYPKECNKVSTVTRIVKGHSAQRLSKITAPVWAVLISSISCLQIEPQVIWWALLPQISFWSDWYFCCKLACNLQFIVPKEDEVIKVQNCCCTGWMENKTYVQCNTFHLFCAWLSAVYFETVL